MKVTVVLSSADHARLAALAEAAGATVTGWVRGAVRAADTHPPTARRVAGMADRDHRGGAREGAGRPRRAERGGAQGVVGAA